MNKRPTIRDVAAMAGVSVATVSRVLSGDYPVANATRTKVQRAVRELDYVVNAHARALSGSTSNVVALVMYDVVTPFFAFIASGVEYQATESDRLCLVCTTHGDPDRELEIVKLMREQHADAVILVGGVNMTDDYRERMYRYAKGLEDAGSRLVLCGRPSLGPDFPAITVEYDNAGGAFSATSHLLSSGHRRIAMLGGPIGNTTFDARLDGYRRALEAFRTPVDPALITHGDMSQDSGFRQVQRMLADGVKFTAIFAANDFVAAGAMRALRAAGKSVPDDVSVIGYDDTPFAPELTPALTSVHLPHEELGRTAVKLALQRGEGSARQHVMLGTHIAMRDSVRPLI
ncbi:LacI family DNA-binding transcriptional regulator [Catellatospora citrea]|uniref:LacI family transcriptional regulator n=1 Tax=Catellatospora citrea TaxID=53366 RepID=A0A8J3P0Y7_9ACTN|nr:LacI family DNA-binding transcriptional regulator [Catellatospora citrea]RKE10222.1 LacI family transcriptional regulator [Catellatospora citrea]GIF97865.1 LacI family transcriptional regulator [Catellatospora citrea]